MDQKAITAEMVDCSSKHSFNISILFFLLFFIFQWRDQEVFTIHRRRGKEEKKAKQGRSSQEKQRTTQQKKKTENSIDK